MQIHALFPTLLGEAEHPDAAALNVDLAAYIRHRERSERDRSPLTTVNEGWQSGLDLLEADLPPVQALKAFINPHLDALLQEMGRLTHGAMAPRSFRYSYRGWAVILRPGGFQQEHLHTRTDLVGVYYVEVPPSQGSPPGGELVLLDPRAGRRATRPLWELDRFSISPRPGALFLFPSYVPHRVDRVHAQGERISINFDVSLEPMP